MIARRNRREFIRDAVRCSGAWLMAMNAAAATADWKDRIGLELYTVRNLTPNDYAGTLEKVAAIGYKEVEPATDYAGLDPKQFRALLDRLGLSMPSTHVPAVDGPDLEKQLEGFRMMGIRYTEIRGGNISGPAPVRGAAPTEELVKRMAELINRHGETVRKFGMKMLIHNHAMEFAPLAGSSRNSYDVLLAETDPTLVAMQLDIGWASVAGQDILGLFRAHPGRFELWHVKDAKGIKDMDPALSQSERMHAANLVPVGEGEVDYKTIFANASVAGLKHFCIEQDNAIEGDSLAAARTSYQNLKRML